MKRIILYAALLIPFTGCYYDNADELYAARDLFSPCDTSGVISFNSDLQPIFEANCGSKNSCHSSGNTTSGIALDNYAAVNDLTIDGSLLGAIRHEPTFKPMPKGGGSLDDCSIQKIESWINRGAPNN